ncbi:hypothetical protein BP5796_12700 [Coleophoma crateriformis]|uniref:Zn(2)-C6 fungal-type domain-containing protein n=1 Tax=Coleophoma crateriformis TaxID=565419 RepID=A0A3D8Q6G8_9HELO|nr:hypothetical protein BP5796_12700 [Coleophoma crateriformis]
MPEKPAGSVRRLREPKRRTTTGCLCCRLRHKKCDELRPTCSGCNRNSLICTWPRERIFNDESSDFGWRIKLHLGKEVEHSTFIEAVNPSPGTSLGSSPDTGSIVTTNSEVVNDESSFLVRGSHDSSDKSCSRQHPRLILTLDENVKAYSLQRSLGAPGCGMLQNAGSRLLFQHYVEITARLLPVTIWMKNPFIAYILPIAQSDDMVMQGLLALSGAHLCYSSASAEITLAAGTHYSLALRSIKQALPGVMKGQRTNILHLLLTTLLLCQVERISGNSEGAVFHHLRASRQLILLDLRDNKNTDNELRGFLLEIYTYLVLVANITLDFESSSRTIVLDPIIFSFQNLQQYPTFGVMFGCAYKLFEVIPAICNLGRQRLLEEKRGLCSQESISQYKSLENEIRDWRPPEDLEPGHENTKQLINAAVIYQHGLWIFLHTSFYASDIKHETLVAKVDRLVEEMFRLLDSLSTKAASTVLWPSIIMGSCIRAPKQQKLLRQMWQISPFRMTILGRTIQLLNWLWEDPDAYGPLGLERVMKIHRVNFCMA